MLEAARDLALLVLGATEVFFPVTAVFFWRQITPELRQALGQPMADLLIFLLDTVVA